MLSAIPLHPVLGRAVSEHKGRPLAGGWLIYVGAIFVAAGLAQLPGIVSALVDGEDTDAVPLALGGVVIGALLLFVCVRKWRQSLVVYEGGFVWERMASAPRTVRWDEITNAEGLTEHGGGTTSYELTVYTRDGKNLTLTDALTDVQRVRGFVTHQARLVHHG